MKIDLNFPTGAAAAPGEDEARQATALLGRARGYSMRAGTYAVLCATSETPEERAAFAAMAVEQCENYIDSIERMARHAPDLIGPREVAGDWRIVQGFAALAAQLPGRLPTLTRAQAIEVTIDANENVLAAIYRILAHIQKRAQADATAQMEAMAERAALVDRMLTDMTRISKMIGMISINASVEAARAGGESGRAFKVIGEEIRNLARQSADLLQGMRMRLIGGHAPSRDP